MLVAVNANTTNAGATVLAAPFVRRRAERRAGRRLAQNRVHASLAKEAIDRGHKKYQEGERFSALQAYESALEQGDATQEQRQEATYMALCVVASWGDVENAKGRVRDLHAEGTSLAAARRAFREVDAAPAVRKVLENADKLADMGSAAPGTTPGAPRKEPPKVDPGKRSSIGVDAAEEVDISARAIAGRLAVVVVTLGAAFAGLFALGLQSFQ